MKTKDFNLKVSIVIPVYNGTNFLGDAIDSALAQTYKNIEVLVINDGSTDNGATEEIAKSYGDRIRYYSRQNGGVATALNFGVEKMTGSYFSWLSHDDMYEKTKIEDQVRYLNSLHAGDVIIACKAKELFASGIKKKEKIDKITFKFIDIFLSTSARVGVNGCSLLIPKRAFEICGDFDIGLPLTQDYDLWFRMKDKFRFELLDKYLVISRRHAEQDSVRKQEGLIGAADELHYKFLNTISCSRFDEYLKFNKNNIKNTYNNYKTYKSRGYKKTSRLMLKNILQYYYENDKNKFHHLFVSELESKNFMSRKSVRTLSDVDRKMIDQEYIELLKKETNDYLIRQHSVQNKPQSKSKVVRITKGFSESIKRDGVYLTGEKVVRKMHAKVTKNRR